MVEPTILTDNELNISPVPNRIYVLEFTSGSANGAVFEIPASLIVGNTVTITTNPATNLVDLGIQTTDSYNLRLAPTLEEVFTTVSLSNGGVLLAGISSLNADVVWVPSGPNTYDQYFLHTTGQFRQAGTTTPAPNVPIIYPDGFLIQKKSSVGASLTVTGQVKTSQTISMLGGGFNLISVVAPVGATLANIGFEDDIQPGISPVGADVVWVQNQSLSFDKYFLHTSLNWRNVETRTVNLTPAEVQAIVLPEAVLIQRKSNTPVMLSIEVPEEYSDL